MFVALFASMLGIVCGLGLFAAFRVNHDPFARMASGGPRLQLSVDGPLVGAASDAAPTATPFGARFAVNLPQARPVAAPVVLADSGPPASSATNDSAAPASAGDTGPIAAATPPTDNPDSANEAPPTSAGEALAPGVEAVRSVAAVTSPIDPAPEVNAQEQDSAPDAKSDAAGARPSATAAPHLRHAGTRRAGLRLKPKAERRRKLAVIRRRPPAPVSNATAPQNPVWPQAVQPTPDATARLARRRPSGLQNPNGSAVTTFAGYDSTPR
jgi:hypothetical protein